MINEKFFITGGAGFIGSHFCAHLLNLENTKKVTIYDNFSSGKEWHYQQYFSDSRLQVIRNDIKNIRELTQAMLNHDTVIHLASNPDISKAITEPEIDFREGTVLTNNILEAMRLSNTKKILYASGSGVYGDDGNMKFLEHQTTSCVSSTYGASKLAGEALISAYCHMFAFKGLCFRFGNVVGPRQTHGVGYDFARNLVTNPNTLQILGDGNQEKSYIYVTDVINAVMTADQKSNTSFDCFNVSTDDTIKVKEIARIACECVGTNNTNFVYTGGDRGWKGDVPIIKLNTEKIKLTGWKPSMDSASALKKAITAIVNDIKQGLITP